MLQEPTYLHELKYCSAVAIFIQVKAVDVRATENSPSFQQLPHSFLDKLHLCWHYNQNQPVLCQTLSTRILQLYMNTKIRVHKTFLLAKKFIILIL